jgi:hypothetical protein
LAGLDFSLRAFKKTIVCAKHFIANLKQAKEQQELLLEKVKSSIRHEYYTTLQREVVAHIPAAAAATTATSIG